MPVLLLCTGNGYEARRGREEEAKLVEDTMEIEGNDQARGRGFN